MGLAFGELTESPLGSISFIAGDGGLQKIAFTTLVVLKAQHTFPEENPSLHGFETVGSVLAELNEYLFGIRKSFSVDIDWDRMGCFQREVLEAAAAVPFGEVATYGEIAKQLGKKGSARAVGRALGDNPMPIVIPCHRVIGADNSLCGYSGGIQKKAFLLTLEGHRLDGERIVFP